MKRILFSIVLISLLLTACVDQNAQVTDSANKSDAGTISVQNAALVQAAKDGNLQAVQTALANGADVDMKTTHGTTALYMASSHGHREVVKLLLEKGADVNVKTTTNGLTALFIASQNGHTEVVNLLIEKGADVNVK